MDAGAHAEIRLGTQGFSYKDWVGPFYPPGTPPAGYLSFYSRVFDTVELDTTFYAVPPAATVRGWDAATPPGFVFAAKLPQAITHAKGLVGAEEELAAFINAMAPLAAKLGPLLIQLPPAFHADRLDDLRRFLGILPAGFRFAIEFRHQSWLTEDVYDLLGEHAVALASIDLYYMPKHLVRTADWTYVRWLGRRPDVTRFDRVTVDRTADLERWAGSIRAVAPEVRTLYGFFNNHYAGHSPTSTTQMKRLLNLPATEPQDAWEQPSLF